MQRLRVCRRGFSEIFGQAVNQMPALLRQTSQANIAEHLSSEGDRLVRHRLRKQVRQHVFTVTETQKDGKKSRQ
jgi:hypothetical protein